MEKLFETMSGQPLALMVFAVVLALIFGVRYMGLWQGQNASPAASASTASVAAVIVDPTALNHATAAVEGLSIVLRESNAIARGHSIVTDRLAQRIEELGEGVDKLRDEVIRSAAKIK